MFYDPTLSFNPFRNDCYLLLISSCCLKRIVRQSRAFFYRERELLINEKLMYFKHLVGSTVEEMLEQKDSFHLVRNEEHGAIHT